MLLAEIKVEKLENQNKSLTENVILSGHKVRKAGRLVMVATNGERRAVDDRS